jgi:hypothetical protein
MHRTAKLRLEVLEDRCILSVFGNPWPNPGHLTLSFAPDGTTISPYSQHSLGEGYTSSLFSTLAPLGNPNVWEMEILRAFQTWAVQANINIGLVSDAGGAFGVPPLAPNTIQAGNIRIGAYPQTTDVIATNSPYCIVSGDWPGDVFLNPNYTFSIGGGGNTRDLFSVVLHEAGNVFGMVDTTTPGSALNRSYQGVLTGLSSSDISSLQALYGPRTPDASEGSTGDNTLATAAPLAATPYNGDTTKYMAVADAEITTLSDVDCYSFQTQANTTSATVYLRTAGLSLFTGKVTVYDSQGNQLTTATSGGPLSGDLSLTVNNLQPSSTYYVRVESGTNNVFGIGSYELKIGYGFDPQTTNTTPALTQVLGNDNLQNTSFATAVPLTTAPGFAANSYYSAFATSSGATDQEFYQVQAPTGASILSVVVDPTQTNQLFTQVNVYDAGQNLLPANVLVNGDGGRYVVQVPNVMPGNTYVIQVVPVGRNGGYYTGDYFLTADFLEKQFQQDSLYQASLTQARSASWATLGVQEAQLVQFSLSAQTADPSIISGMRMILYDANGNIVFTMTANAGQVGSGTVVLMAGTYTVKYEAATMNGAALPTMNFSLGYVRLGHPIGPYAINLGSDYTAPPPSVIVYSDNYYASLGYSDPWLNPWQF